MLVGLGGWGGPKGQEGQEGLGRSRGPESFGGSERFRRSGASQNCPGVIDFREVPEVWEIWEVQDVLEVREVQKVRKLGIIAHSFQKLKRLNRNKVASNPYNSSIAPSNVDLWPTLVTLLPKGHQYLLERF